MSRDLVSSVREMILGAKIGSSVGGGEEVARAVQRDSPSLRVSGQWYHFFIYRFSFGTQHTI